MNPPSHSKQTTANHGAPAKPKGAEQPVLCLTEIKNILVPVDFSDPARRAVKCAVRFAGRFDAKLTLLNVVEPVGMPDFDAFPLAADPHKIVRAVKARMKQLCRQEGIEASLLQDIQVRQGKAYHEIVEAARDLKMDLIIIATHGYTGLSHVLLGSTTERVVRHAPCPVLVVRESGQSQA